jgi:hypothetical protein
MNPLFNMREICKQSALLEDHLNNARKRCSDCIRKHFLTIEALFEEAVSLDKNQDYGDILDGRADDVRTLQNRWIDNEDPLVLAQELRLLRKNFAPICFDLRPMKEASHTAANRLWFAMHVADVYLARRSDHTSEW